MREMKFNNIKACFHRSVGSFHEIFLQLVDFGNAHAARRGVVLVERFRAGTVYIIGPPVYFLGGGCAGAEPGCYAGSFAAGVG